MTEASLSLKCPECGSTHVFKDGFRPAPLNALSSEPIQRYRCSEYGHRFSEHVTSLNSVSDNSENNRISASMVKNLVSTQELKTCAEKKEHTPTENEIKAAPQIERLLTQVSNDGRRPGTVRNYRITLTRLLREGANLFDPESTKAALAKAKMKGSTKKNMAARLDVWFNFNEIKWKAPTYSGESEIPYIPSEAKIDPLIASLGKKTSTFCQILKETGARCGEIAASKWTDIDFGERKIRIKAEKGSNSRVLPLSAKVIEMLCNLPRNKERIFANPDDMRSLYYFQRKKAARRLADPELMLIHFHTFRHWKATTEQHRTKDPWHVKMILGHKSIKSTETYIHLEKMLYESEANDSFIVKVANTLEEAIKLMEVGFDYHAEVEGNKLFRKRK